MRRSKIGWTLEIPIPFVQFDTVSRVMECQSRFRWILGPGNGLHVVYTHNWRENPLVDRICQHAQKSFL